MIQRLCLTAAAYLACRVLIGRWSWLLMPSVPNFNVCLWRKSGLRVFVDTGVIRGGPLLEVAGHGREAGASRPQVQRGCCEQHYPPRAIRGRCYCVRNLYATIRATMLAKISSARRDFRIIGIVEWRAADRPG
jgi:hypothetical protein